MFHQCYSFGHAEIENGILLLFHVSEFGLPIFCLHFFVVVVWVLMSTVGLVHCVCLV